MTDEFPAGVAIGFVLGCLLASWIAVACMDKQYQTEAVQHGFAEYNQTNGNWQWKEGGK